VLPPKTLQILALKLLALTWQFVLAEYWPQRGRDLRVDPL
jgi:hypothetical protein